MRKKVLLIRLDKIGDLICTLPTDQILDPKVYDVTWVVSKGLGQIIDCGKELRKYIELDKSDIKKSEQVFFDFLNQNNFDIAVSFQCPWWVNQLLMKARIPKRIGVLSQWHSFLFLNVRLRQKRSQALKHEFEYNLDLVKKITGPIPNELTQSLYFHFKKNFSPVTLEKFKLPLNYVVIHPGMMGSALNLPEDKYLLQIQILIDQGKNIVITGTDADEPYLKKIKSAYSENANVFILQSKLSFKELLDVLYYSEFIIAPSTGVAHIAAALEKIIYGIYSPIKVHSPIRWAPRGPHVHVLAPQVQCPAQFKCQGKKCRSYYCMDTINLNTINLIQNN